MEPLAQLKDIHLPEQINNYPLSFGWWLLVLIIIATVVFIIKRVKRSRRQKRYQQQAIRQLQNNPVDNHTTISVLKWAAIQYFPRDHIASLYGLQFKEFLISALPDKHRNDFAIMSTESFDTLYQKKSKTNNQLPLDTKFQQAALLWLKQALPPQNKSMKIDKNGPIKSGIAA